MNSNRNLLVLALFLGGLALIGVSIFISPSTARKSPPASTALARAERLTGQVSLFRAGSPHREALTAIAPLFHFDSIETGELGEVLLKFESSGDRLRLKEHSLATLEKVEDQKGFHVVFVLKRGQFEIESVGREGHLFIAKNGERIAVQDYQRSALARAPLVPEPLPSASPVATVAPLENATQGLSEGDVQMVMNAHRTSFLKCYTQLLQREPTAKGEVNLSFTLENSGKITSSEVSSKELTQKDFQECLREVLRRIEFRSFQGPSISTFFPLKFE